MVADAVVYRESMFVKSGSKWNSLMKMDKERNEYLEYMQEFIANAKSEIKKGEVSIPAAAAQKIEYMHKNSSWRVEITEGSSGLYTESGRMEKFSGMLKLRMRWKSIGDPIIKFNSIPYGIIPHSVRREDKGTVVVHMQISPGGEIIDAKVQRYSGSVLLNRIALDIARKAFKKPERKFPAKLEIEVFFEFLLTDCNMISSC